MRKIGWELKSGKQASVIVDLKKTDRIWADGHEIEVPACRILISADVDGQFIGNGRPAAPSAAAKKAFPDAAGMIGKLAIMPEQMEQIKAAIAEVEASPEWQAKLAKEAKADQEAIEYDDHRRKMKKVMGY